MDLYACSEFSFKINPHQSHNNITIILGPRKIMYILFKDFKEVATGPLTLALENISIPFDLGLGVRHWQREKE